MGFAGTLIRAGTVAAVLMVAACDDEVDSTGPGDDVYGVWQADNDTEGIVLDIQTEQILVYQEDDAADCYDVFAHAILDREGDVFTIQDGGAEQVTTIRREGDGLVIETDDEGSTYTWLGDELPSTVNEC